MKAMIGCLEEFRAIQIMTLFAFKDDNLTEVVVAQACLWSR